MLSSLKIRNIALINEAIIEFGEGLNILSGETGAGKSIVVDSMNLVLGERADRELIKSGQDSATVEAVFYIPRERTQEFFESNDIECDDDCVIVTRKLSQDGRNTCRINGCAVSISALRQFMESFVDLHGQHEHQALLYPSNHIKFVDSFAGEKISALKQKISEKRHELLSYKKELSALGGSNEEILKQIDYLEYQISEIEKAEIKPGEEDELKKELEILKNAESISKILYGGHSALSGEGSVLEILSDIRNGLSGISENSKSYENLLSQVSDAYYQLEDASHEMKSLSDSVYFDQQRFDEINDRLDIIHEMKRKYGGSEQAVIDFYNEAADKINRLKNSDTLIDDLERKISDCCSELYGLHLEALDIRQRVSGDLERLVLHELNDLGMNSAEFYVAFSKMPDQNDCDFSKAELTDCEFYISTNLGEPAKPLSKVASGGEISRIMLAFKNVFAFTDNIDTLIFDEIDTGISGHMAQVVAEKMSRIATKKQVICVTHLPQIVAFGDSGFLISKHSELGKTRTEIIKLDRQGKINEVARLVGGDTSSAVSHAAGLVDSADSIKEKM